MNNFVEINLKIHSVNYVNNFLSINTFLNEKEETIIEMKQDPLTIFEQTIFAVIFGPRPKQDP